MLKRAYGQVQTSVLISQEFYEQCKKHHIKFSEALRVGVSLLLSEKGLREYDNGLNIVRKIQLIQDKLNETSQKYYELVDKMSNKK